MICLLSTKDDQELFLLSKSFWIEGLLVYTMAEGRLHKGKIFHKTSKRNSLIRIDKSVLVSKLWSYTYSNRKYLYFTFFKAFIVRHWRRFSFFTVNLEKISDIALVFNFEHVNADLQYGVLLAKTIKIFSNTFSTCIKLLIIPSATHYWFSLNNSDTAKALNLAFFSIRLIFYKKHSYH